MPTVTRRGQDWPYGATPIATTLANATTRESTSLAHAAAVSNAARGPIGNNTLTRPVITGFADGVLSGTGAVGDTIVVDVDASEDALGPEPVGADGTWTIEAELEGGEVLLAKAHNTNGNVTPAAATFEVEV